VRLVAEAHGGTATVEDVADGGALFRLRLEAPAPPELRRVAAAGATP
jgi:signal transduction histidine kinase